MNLRALVLVVCGGAVFLLGQTQIGADIFVLKAGPYFGDAALSSRGLIRILNYGWLLLLPLAWWGLAENRAFVFAALRSHLGLSIVAGILMLVAAFPWASVLVGGATSASPIALELMRDGLTRPLALFVCALGFFGSNRASFGGLAAGRALALVVGVAVLLLLLQPLWRGMAFPRLEDETAYHLQALLFSEGRLVGRLQLPAFAAGMDPTELVPAAWLLFDGNRFLSAHLHGWSALLAAARVLHLQGLLPALLGVACVLVFWQLTRTLFPREHARQATALGLFAGTPIFVTLANSYMSHVLALLLSLVLILLWVQMRPPAIGARLGSLPWVVRALVFVVVAAAYSLVRLQTLVPLLCAFALAELLPAPGGRPDRGARIAHLGLFVLAALAAIFLPRWYAGLLGVESPVLMSSYMERYLVANCQALGFGPGYGCFPTYGTMGHTLLKSALNGLDILARWSAEAAPLGFAPFVAVVIPLALYRLRRSDPFERMLLFLFAGHSVLFALYFHYGGESYRGRYLAEVTFVLPLLFVRLLNRTPPVHNEPNAARGWGGTGSGSGPPVHLVLGLMAIIMLAAVTLSIRPDYFNVYVAPSRSVATHAATPRAGALLVFPHHTDVAPVNGLRVPNEFVPGEEVVFSPRQVHRFLNTGYSTAAAGATGFGPHGLPVDRFGNTLLGAGALGSVEQWVQFLKSDGAYVAEYSSARPPAGGGQLRAWTLPSIRLARVPERSSGPRR